MDPITISAVIGGAKALKGAFDVAKEAMDEFRACAEAGMTATESMGSLIKVFTAQGEAQKAINEAKRAKVDPAPVTEDGSPAEPVPKKSATVQALEAMQYERELKAQEEELKTYLIYNFNEPGLYAELCARRDAIVNAEREEEEGRRRAETERILAIKREEMRKRRERQRMWELMENTATLILGVAVSAAIIYGIVWMFQFGGK